MDRERTHFSIGNILGETIKLYGDNFLALWLPYILVSYPISLIHESITANSGSSLVNILSALAVYAVGAAVSIFVTLAALDRYGNRGGSVKDFLKGIGGYYISYCLLQILIFLGIMGGFLLLVIPGIIFTLRWTVGSVALIEEKPGIKASLKRSRDLTMGFKGQIFLTFLVIVLAYLALILPFALISHFLAGGYSAFWDILSSLGSEHLNPLGMAYGILSTLLNPLYSLLAVVMFFNLKKEKEGYSAEELADSFLDGNDEVPGR